MTVVLAADKLFSHMVHKRFGLPYLYGVAQFGHSHYGDFGVYIFDVFYGSSVYGIMHYGPKCCLSGIYKRRPTHLGTTSVKIDYYRPPTNNRPAQLARRAKFRNAIEAWQVLTLPQRQVYNDRAIKLRYSGYNLFIKEYMLS